MRVILLSFFRKFWDFFSSSDTSSRHPGGLVDAPGGKEEFILDVDDNLYQGPNRSTRISCEDLADLYSVPECIEARR
jgi:hypothetical protein